MKARLGLATFIMMTSTVYATTVYTDANKPIVVSKKARDFTVELTANPTTGYMWFLKNLNDDFITVKKHYFSPPTELKIGAPGLDVWEFEVNAKAVNAPLIVELNFIYTKP